MQSYTYYKYLIKYTKKNRWITLTLKKLNTHNIIKIIIIVIQEKLKNLKTIIENDN